MDLEAILQELRQELREVEARIERLAAMEATQASSPAHGGMQEGGDAPEAFALPPSPVDVTGKGRPRRTVTARFHGPRRVV